MKTLLKLFFVCAVGIFMFCLGRYTAQNDMMGEPEIVYGQLEAPSSSFWLEHESRKYYDSHPSMWKSTANRKEAL